MKVVVGISLVATLFCLAIVGCDNASFNGNSKAAAPKQMTKDTAAAQVPSPPPPAPAPAIVPAPPPPPPAPVPNGLPSCVNTYVNGVLDSVSQHHVKVLLDSLNMCESEGTCEKLGGQLAWTGLKLSDDIEACAELLGGWGQDQPNEIAQSGYCSAGLKLEGSTFVVPGGVVSDPALKAAGAICIY